MSLRTAAINILAWLVAAHAFAQNAEITKAVRALIEPALKEQVGIGFQEFSCDARMPLEPGDRFVCKALDEEGDRLRYTLEINDDGIAKVVLASQAATSLEPEVLNTLGGPCRELLAAFDARDWNRLFAGLHPALRRELERDQVLAQLETVRSVLGQMSEPLADWYSVTGAQSHRLEFRLPAEMEGAVARFGLASQEDGTWAINAFLIHAEPGSAAGVVLAKGLGRSLLSQVLGTPVQEIRAPLGDLTVKGDLVEGSVRLEDGRQLPIAVAQTSNVRGFETHKYFFSVLDAALVVTMEVEKRIEDLREVKCEAPQVPDGGEVRCVVTRDEAPPFTLILSRRGTEHRLRSESPAGR